MFRFLLVSLLTLLLTSCIGADTVITGKVSESIDFNQVEVFYNTNPDCQYNVIAQIKIPGEYFSQRQIIDGFRQQAAEIGAPAVQVTYLQRTGTGEYYGSARAIRCG